MNSQEVKVQLREKLKNLRESLSSTEREIAASQSELKILNLSAWKKAKVICIYASFKGELPTNQLLHHLLNSDKKCALPRVNRKGLPELCLVQSFEDLELSSLEIPEPKKNCPLIKPSEVDFYLVPGIGFDRQGNRLGHGSGFYDRLLAQANPAAFFLGYGYDFQVVESIPHEAHDITVHAVATPTQIIHIKPA